MRLSFLMNLKQNKIVSLFVVCVLINVFNVYCENVTSNAITSTSTNGAIDGIRTIGSTSATISSNAFENVAVVGTLKTTKSTISPELENKRIWTKPVIGQQLSKKYQQQQQQQQQSTQQQRQPPQRQITIWTKAKKPEQGNFEIYFYLIWSNEHMTTCNKPDDTHTALAW